MSKVEEIGRAITRFRDAGKPVIAVADYYGQSQYLLASYANTIFLHPMGIVDVLGLSSYQTYMQEALGKLKVKVNVFRTGPHKSAVEPFIASEMSEESREQTQWLLDDLWAEYQNSVLSRRKISKDAFKQYTHSIDQTMLETKQSLAEIALETNLVDELVTRDQLIAKIQAIAGINKKGDFYLHTNALAYLAAESKANETEEELPKVGYIVAKGQILDGIQPAGSIGGDSLALQLKRARLHGDLKALVLRIDSPGGSAFASEVIRRELALFEIPIVVSMGSLAASGGYWIAMPADEIWAMPTTITGSIGAFSVVPTIDETLNSLGLNVDGVKTTPLSGSFRLDRPLSDQAKTIFQSQIDHLYGEFLNVVSEGRYMTIEQLKPIAGGRVWTGNQALELDLVDHLGDQLDAIASAAERANLGEDYQIHKVGPHLSYMQEIIANLTGNISEKFETHSLSWLKKFGVIFDQIEDSEVQLLFSDPNHMYLHCSDCLIDI